MTDTPRTPTPIDEVADAWVDTLSDLDPTLGTYIGREEGNDRYGDLSPEGHDRYVEAVRSARSKLTALAPVDAIDEVTKTDLLSELDLELEFDEARWHQRDLNVLASAVQDVRQVYDLMPTSTADDWAMISRRLGAVPDALRGYAATLRQGIETGTVPARRQVVEVAGQIVRYTADDGFFASFVANAQPEDGELPASLARELADNASAARVAYDELRSFLTGTLAPAASEDDAVGRDLYALHSRRCSSVHGDRPRRDVRVGSGTARLDRSRSRRQSRTIAVPRLLRATEPIEQLDAARRDSSTDSTLCRSGCSPPR